MPMPSVIAKLRIETKVAFGCVGLMAICALVMLFNGAHRTAVAITASQALVGVLLAFNAARKTESSPSETFPFLHHLPGDILLKTGISSALQNRQSETQMSRWSVAMYGTHPEFKLQKIGFSIRRWRPFPQSCPLYRIAERFVDNQK